MMAFVVSPMVSIVVKATLVLVVALTGIWLASRNRAALRHAFLAAAFVALLALPLAALIAPVVSIAVPEDMQVQVTAAALHELPDGLAANSLARPGKVVTTARPDSSPFDLFLVCWLVGSAIFLLPMAMGMWQVRRLRRSGVVWQRGQSLVGALAREMGIDRRVKVVLHEGVAGPMTCGIFRPGIVLPPDAEHWDEEDVNRALIHELEHVRRGDWAVHLLARTVCAAYWFHPLAWVALRQLTLQAERACDDAVLGRSEATAYADQLVMLAQRLSVAAKSPALGMANRADLSARVGAVLNSRQRRGRAGALQVAATFVTAALFIGIVAPLRMVAAPQNPVASVPALTVAAPPVVLAQAAAPRNVAPQVAIAPAPRPADIVAPMQFGDNVMLVITDISVTDANGSAVENLHPEDFVVTEDGEPQTISVFEFQKLSGVPQGTEGVQSYYIAGYYTTNQMLDDQYRKLAVKLRNDSGYKVDYRAGYYSGRPGATGIGPAVRTEISKNFGPGFVSPVLISKTDPQYSEQARKAKYSGSVILSVDVDASGEVIGTHLIRPLGMGLDKKAVEAVTQWKFRPGTKDGKPVPMQVQLEVNFRLL